MPGAPLILNAWTNPHVGTFLSGSIDSTGTVVSTTWYISTVWGQIGVQQGKTGYVTVNGVDYPLVSVWTQTDVGGEGTTALVTFRAATLLRHDLFPGSALDPVWSVIRGTFAVGSNLVSATSNGTGAPKNVCLLGSDVYDDVEVSMTIGPAYNGLVHIGGPIVRATIVGTSMVSGIRLVWKPVPSSPELGQIMATPIVNDAETGNLLDPGSEGDPALNVPFLAGDKMTLRVVGTKVAAYKNGVLIREVDVPDLTILSGRVGFFVVNTLAPYPMANFEAYSFDTPIPKGPATLTAEAGFLKDSFASTTEAVTDAEINNNSRGGVATGLRGRARSRELTRLNLSN